MTEPRTGRRPAGWQPTLGRSGPLGRLLPTSAYGVTIAVGAGFAVLLLLYLVVDTIILLVPLVALAVFGVDRVLRLHPEGRFHGPTATLLYLSVPGLFALAAGLLLAGVDGLWTVPAALGAAILFGITVNAEYLTVDPDTETYEPARLILLIVVYLVALAIFVAVFTADLPLVLGIALVAATAFLLTIDVLRELAAETTSLLWQAGAVALVMAECRLALYFLSLADLLGGAFLFVVFYFITGIVQNQVSDRLDRATFLTYAGVALGGLVIVLAVRLLFV